MIVFQKKVFLNLCFNPLKSKKKKKGLKAFVLITI